MSQLVIDYLKFIIILDHWNLENKKGPHLLIVFMLS